MKMIYLPIGFIVKIIRLEQHVCIGQESTLRGLADEVVCIGLIQNDLGEHVISTTAYSKVNIVLYLTADDLRIRSLCS